MKPSSCFRAIIAENTELRKAIVAAAVVSFDEEGLDRLRFVSVAP